MPHRTRAHLAAFVVGLAAVSLSLGCDDDSPANTPTPANLQAIEDLDFACGVDCSFTGQAVNDGPGCAQAVRGVTSLMEPDGSDLASDEWELDPDRQINAGEVFIYEGCCFNVLDVGTMGSYSTEITWQDVSCS